MFLRCRRILWSASKKKKEEKRNNSIKTLIIRERNYRVFPGSLVILERARLDENYREEDKKKPEREKERGEESGKKEKKRGERARRVKAEGKEEGKKETEGNSMKTQRMLRTRGSDLEIYVESMTGWEACLRKRVWRKRRRGLLKRRVAQKPTEWIHRPASRPAERKKERTRQRNPFRSFFLFAIRASEKNKESRRNRERDASLLGAWVP